MKTSETTVEQQNQSSNQNQSNSTQPQDVSNSGVSTTSWGNNNPFGIRKTGINWVGEIQSENIWENFDTIAHGIRAGVKNLQTGYFSQGLDTIEKIVPVYVGTDRPATVISSYKNNLVQKTGLPVNKVLNQTDKMKVAYEIGCYESPQLRNYISFNDFVSGYEQYIN